MGDRRMFSLKIINTSKFLRLPQDTQNLYFHLGLRADDDGIVEAYPVMKAIGASEDSLKLLHAKNLIQVLNEELISYIIDWNEHNKLRPDRKVNSIYRDLLVQMLPDVKIMEPKKRSDKVNGIADKRKDTTEIPYSFSYKIRNAFVGELCPICNRTMIAKGDCQSSIQHCLPLSMGGEHKFENIAVVCFSCNMKTKTIDTGKLNNQEVMRVWKMFGQSNDRPMTVQGQSKDDPMTVQGQSKDDPMTVQGHANHQQGKLSKTLLNLPLELNSFKPSSLVLENLTQGGSTTTTGTVDSAILSVLDNTVETAYRENMGQLLLPLVSLELKKFIKLGITSELIILAIRKSCNATNPSEYLLGTLKKLLVANILTVEDYDKAKEKHDKEKKRRDKMNQSKIPQLTNFDQRNYSDEEYAIFEKNL